MKKAAFFVFLASVLSTVCLMNCTKDEEQMVRSVGKINLDTLTLDPSMKGWELYSWPNGSDWNYSILGGTNRLKSYEEVTTNEIMVCGTDSLKMLLDKIPENENIFWIGKGWLERCWGSGYGNLSLPDSQIIIEIQAYCTEQNLIMNISD